MDEPHEIRIEVPPTYLGIERLAFIQGFREGLVEGAHRMLLVQGQWKFGPPDAAARALIESTSDLVQLETWAVRLLSAGSWKELLTPPALSRRSHRRGTRGWAPAPFRERRPSRRPYLAARQAPRYAAGGGSRESG
jgi:hypothetical protein